MKEHVPLGMNRTGVQMSPFDTHDMNKAVPVPGAQIPPGDESAIAELRGEYISQSDPIGSVPVPGTMKGMVSSGVEMMTGKQPQLLIDKLGERLAFERTGTRLYDAVIAKFNATNPSISSLKVDDLIKIRTDEARHFALIANAIESIGGDPTTQTPCADLAGVEAQGLMQVVTDPRTSMAQSLHAILVAEMADNAGWELLITLAQEHNQNAMIGDFQIALEEEREHLQLVRAWYEEATLGTPLINHADDMSTTTTPSKSRSKKKLH